MKGIISKASSGREDTEENVIADSGYSFPVVSDQLVKKLGIRIKPFKRPVNIIEASGNSLNLLGSEILFIQSQVLGNRIELVEAAVLEGNTVDREKLISLDLLIQWDLLPPGFSNVIITNYFNELEFQGLRAP